MSPNFLSCAWGAVRSYGTPVAQRDDATFDDATAISLVLLIVGWLGLFQMIANQVWPAKFISPGLFVTLTPLGMVASAAEGVSAEIHDEITGDPMPPDLVNVRGMLAPPVKGIGDE